MKSCPKEEQGKVFGGKQTWPTEGLGLALPELRAKWQEMGMEKGRGLAHGGPQRVRDAVSISSPCCGKPLKGCKQRTDNI